MAAQMGSSAKRLLFFALTVVALAEPTHSFAQKRTVVRTPDTFFFGAIYPTSSTFYPLANNCQFNPCDNHYCSKYSESLSQVISNVNQHPTLNASSCDYGSFTAYYAPEPRPPVSSWGRQTYSCNPQGNVTQEQYCLGTGYTGGYETYPQGTSSWVRYGIWYLSEQVACLASEASGLSVPVSDWRSNWLNGQTITCSKEIEIPPPPNECSGKGNPVDPGSGAKIQRENDFALNSATALSVSRVWNSNTQRWSAAHLQSLGLPQGIGLGGEYCEFVRNSLTGARKYICAAEAARSNQIFLHRADGSIIAVSAVAPFQPLDPQNRHVRVSRDGTDWTAYLGTDHIERYDAAGRLLSLTDLHGRVRTITYRNADGSRYPQNAPACTMSQQSAADRPECMTDWSGRQIIFTYGASGEWSGFLDPTGAPVVYEYGGPSATLPPELAGSSVLTSVIYQDGRRRIYHYNNPALLPSNAPRRAFLTGLSDENGNRVGSYAYDAKGRAVITEHANGLNRYQFSYAALDAKNLTYVDGSRSVVDVILPNGSTTVEGYQRIGSAVKRLDVSQPAGAGCGPASSSLTYDANANVTSRLDFTNRKTCYANDLSRNLETARIEGFTSSDTCPADAATYTPATGTAQRKLLTQWHPDWRLETRKSEPKRITTSVYNGQPDLTAGGAIVTCAPGTALVDGKPIAVLCRSIEQATSDETGAAGFAASAVGAARTETWTYNSYGQTLTHNGARTDVSDLTTYEYYPDTQANWTLGDLKQITNPLGQITRFTKYDRNGRLLEQIDANNLKTEHSYSPRGWLTQTKLTAPGGATQTTTYEYDGVRQLLKATLPDASFVAYTYDAAHRLTQVADSTGNRVEYTLDAMGNRTAENWKDSSGALRKTLTRVIDALNRVQTTSGGLQ